MKLTVRENLNPPYSVHDMYIMDFVSDEDKITITTQSGMVKTTPPYEQLNGHIEINGVRWDYSYAYLLDFIGNIGRFTGEKFFLKDYFLQYSAAGFTVMDETFGYNCIKLSGYTAIDRKHFECIIEIYHEGEMIYYTNE